MNKIIKRFEVGNWYIYQGKTYHLLSNNSGYWTIEDTDGNKYSPCEPIDIDDDDFHHWTIADAKDGDVLATLAGAFIYNGNNGGGSCPGSYCGINTLGKFQTGVEHHWTGKKVYPATKEQRDLLFQKMKEKGYEWDGEKKELKIIDWSKHIKYEPNSPSIIEQKQVIDYPDSLPKDNWELIHEFVNKFGGIPKDEDELNVLIEYVLKRQKPAWSEDDERMYIGLHNLIYVVHGCDCDSKEKLKFSNWLKSLKDRVFAQPK